MSEAEEKLAKILHYQTSSPGFKWESEGNWYKNKCRGRAREIMEAGYLPVEPIQLEGLSDEGMKSVIKENIALLNHEERSVELLFKVSQATNAHNKTKFGELYRIKPE